MKKGNIFSSGFDREKWIAVVFVLIILCVPVFTFISSMFPQSEEDGEDMGKNVLQGNGTLQGKVSPEEADPNEMESGNVGVEVRQPLFEALCSAINEFTNELFLKDEFISFNINLTKMISGNDYIESTQVLLGKEDWLFYKTELDGNPLLDYKGTNRFTDQELAEIAVNLTYMRNYFEEEKGVRFVLMGLPNKENLYSEYMPDTIPRLIEPSRGDQLAEYLQENTDLNYVYPKEIFLQEKERYQLYYMTDTHWNQIGAFIGLQAFFRQTYGTYAEPDSVKFLVSEYDFAGDLATIAGITEDYSIDTAYVLDINSINPEQYQDEVLLVVGDSFAGFLAIVAEPYYKKVYRVDSKDFTMSMLDTYQVDTVIWESVERRIDIFKDESLVAQW